VKKIYKSKFNDYTNRRFNSRFEKQFKQYIIEYKEESNKDSETETNDIFESLILNIESELNYEKESESTIYFIAFRELTFNKVTFINTVLANKAFSYFLTSENITKPIPATNLISATDSISATDLFIYILNIFSSQYTSDMFLDIIVNIKTNKKSIAGYS
jgi:hypothetical protein